MTAELNINAERAAFDAWMKTRSGYPFAAAFANLMWAAWQAARRAPAPVADGLAPLPQLLLDRISDYGMARTEGMTDVDRVHLWETLINDVKRYAANAIAADSAQQAVVAPSGMLTADEMAALRRFDECAQDGEGYDVPNEMMQRLAEIGVVQRRSGAYYQATEFGQHMLGNALTTAAPQDQGAGMQVARCSHCDDTGDAHRPDGDWRGECDCPAGVGLTLDRLKIAAKKTQEENEDLRAQLAQCVAESAKWAAAAGAAHAQLARQGQDTEPDARLYFTGADFTIHMMASTAGLLREQFGGATVGLYASPAQASAAPAMRECPDCEGTQRISPVELCERCKASGILPASAAPGQARAAVPGDFLPKRDVADEIALLSNVMREHPQLKSVIGREALLMRCVRKGLAASPEPATAAVPTTADSGGLPQQSSEIWRKAGKNGEIVIGPKPQGEGWESLTLPGHTPYTGQWVWDGDLSLSELDAKAINAEKTVAVERNTLLKLTNLARVAIVQHADRAPATSQAAQPVEQPAYDAVEPPSKKQEKLRALANRIDHENLWKRPMMYRDQLTDDQRDRLDAGCMLRRYADLLAPGRWLVLPPTGNLQFSAGSLDEVTEMAKRDLYRTAMQASKGATDGVVEGE